MRPRPASSLTAPLFALLLLLWIPLAACEQSASPHAPAPIATPAITIAYDIQLNDPLSTLLANWRESNSTPINTLADASTAITLSAQGDHSPPDVIILTAQAPLPTGDRAPISVRPWLTDPLVYITTTDETRPPADILIDPDARIAIGVEAGPMGQYTRFGLRKIRRWDLVKNRVFRHSNPEALLEAVRTQEAVMGIAYATMLAQNPDGLAAREELEVSNTALQAFVVIAQTPAGVELARWLTQPEQIQAAAAFGYRPHTPLKPSPASPEQD